MSEFTAANFFDGTTGRAVCHGASELVSKRSDLMSENISYLAKGCQTRQVRT